MKTRFRLCLLVSLFVFASANAQAQDPFYGQIFTNRLNLSPALAGSTGAANVMAQYRAQWVNIPGFYSQVGIAYDQALGNGWNWGATLHTDHAGEILTMSLAHLHFAKELKLAENHRLRLGFSGGMQFRTIDYLRLRFPDQINPRTGLSHPTLPSGPDHFVQADFNTGLVYYNRYFYFIGTLKHLQGDWLERDQSQVIRELPRLYSITSGLRIPILSDLEGLGGLSINPAVHYQRQGAYEFYMLGLSLETKYLQIMSWWQPNERISGGVGTTLGPVQIAYQYDRYLTDLANISGSSHELSLAFRLGGKKKRERSAMPIPKF
ncbi:MAG: PorP/SprF family type IX secretion system membrane protein [Bacteroidia bacterium]